MPSMKANSLMSFGANGEPLRTSGLLITPSRSRNTALFTRAAIPHDYAESQARIKREVDGDAGFSILVHVDVVERHAGRDRVLGVIEQRGIQRVHPVRQID